MSDRPTQSNKLACSTTSSKESSLALSPIAAVIRTSIIGLGLGLAHSTVNAATITVDSNLDDGLHCTLRAAIDSINAGVLVNGCLPSSVTGNFGSDDAIEFDMPSNSITLNGSQLNIDNSLVSINGGNDNVNIDISADNRSRVFFLDSSIVTLNNLTIRNGHATGSGNTGSGGGIYVKEGYTTITNSTISQNFAYQEGAGIFAPDGASMSISDSRMLRNYAYSESITRAGSAIHTSGKYSVILISDSIFSDNTVTSGGAAILAEELAIVKIEDSLIGRTFQNQFNGGSAIQARSGAGIDITGSTVSGTNMYGNSTAIVATGVGPYYPTYINVNNSIVSGVSSDFGRTIGIEAADGASIGVTNSTVTGSLGWSGAFGVKASGGGSVGLVNSTVSGNSTYIGDVAGVATTGSGSYIRLLNSTVTDTSVYSYSYNYGHNDFSNIINVSNSPGSNISIVNSILSNARLIGAPPSSTTVPLDCSGVVTVDSTSIISDGTCGATVSGDPRIGSLTDNGGPTPTHALNVGSIAIDSGDNDTCLTTDQRYEPRDDGACDVGAFEFQPEDDQTQFYVIPLVNGNTAVVPF
ncbi:hypothetical protein N9060_01025 [Arenicella sp.]|nr:hypothetical protein [Arenicella sp.]